MTPPVDDPEALHRILTNTHALLLDFDSPICSVFAGYPAHFIADHLREVLAESGHSRLPPECSMLSTRSRCYSMLRRSVLTRLTPSKPRFVRLKQKRSNGPNQL